MPQISPRSTSLPPTGRNWLRLIYIDVPHKSITIIIVTRAPVTIPSPINKPPVSLHLWTPRPFARCSRSCRNTFLTIVNRGATPLHRQRPPTPGGNKTTATRRAPRPPTILVPPILSTRHWWPPWPMIVSILIDIHRNESACTQAEHLSFPVIWAAIANVRTPVLKHRCSHRKPISVEFIPWLELWSTFYAWSIHYPKNRAIKRLARWTVLRINNVSINVLRTITTNDVWNNKTNPPKEKMSSPKTSFRRSLRRWRKTERQVSCSLSSPVEDYQCKHLLGFFLAVLTSQSTSALCQRSSSNDPEQSD